MCSYFVNCQNRRKDMFHGSMNLYISQGRQGTYNETLRRVRVTIVAVEKQQILYILSVRFHYCLSYPVCNAFSPYYILIFYLSGCTIFFHFLVKDPFFGKVTEIKCLF